MRTFSSPHLLMRRFFQDYKLLEGNAVGVDEIRPAAEAYPIILDALHRYSEQRRKGLPSRQTLAPNYIALNTKLISLVSFAPIVMV